MVIWSLQVAIRGTVSLTAYKTELKNARHRLNEASRSSDGSTLKLALMRCCPGCFPCRFGEYANQTAGGDDEPALRSSRTYVQMRPVFVFFRPGASTFTGVSSV